MKNSFYHITLLFAAGLLVASCAQTPESDQAATTEAQDAAAAAGATYAVDLSASTLEWIGAKVTARHSGTLALKSGSLTVDGENLTGGSFVIDMNSLTVTGPEGTDPGMNANLQGHLMSPDFFDVPTYPEAVFEITGITVTTDTIVETEDPGQTEVSRYKVTNPTHRISGNLTIKDQTKNIEFPAKVTVANGTVEAMAKFTIDRTNWGITYAGKADDLIRNEVYIGLALKANQ